VDRHADDVRLGGLQVRLRRSRDPGEREERQEQHRAQQPNSRSQHELSSLWLKRRVSQETAICPFSSRCVLSIGASSLSLRHASSSTTERIASRRTFPVVVRKSLPTYSSNGITRTRPTRAASGSSRLALATSDRASSSTSGRRARSLKDA